MVRHALMLSGHGPPRDPRVTRPSPTGSILVVDDEPSSRELLEIILEEAGHQTETCSGGREALEWLAHHRFDLVVSDLQMPGMDGLELTQAIRERHPLVEVLILTAFGSQERAHAFDTADLIHRIARLVEKSRMAFELDELRRTLKGQRARQAILGESKAIRAVLDKVPATARTDYPVVITGESGTGKELVAHAVHQASHRASGPFVPVNCGAIPDTLFESELFGHVKGAYTGAIANRAGLFEEADGGTLFLDEIGELSIESQVKLLRALQSSEIKRVGSSRTIRVDARIICATNRDLAAMVDRGEFRQDLYYRLHVIPIHLPPLRERSEDVPLLARRFLGHANAELDRPCPGFTAGALAKLRAHAWPGNVRELENKVRQAAMAAAGREITEADIPVDAGPTGRGMAAGIDTELTLDAARDRFERDYLVACLERHAGAVTKVAEAMGLHRNSVYHLMRKHGLDAAAYR
jgi:DNA-binding NtrC family response regulator